MDLLSAVFAVVCRGFTPFCGTVETVEARVGPVGAAVPNGRGGGGDDWFRGRSETSVAGADAVLLVDAREATDVVADETDAGSEAAVLTARCEPRDNGGCTATAIARGGTASMASEWLPCNLSRCCKEVLLLASLCGCRGGARTGSVIMLAVWLQSFGTVLCAGCDASSVTDGAEAAPCDVFLRRASAHRPEGPLLLLLPSPAMSPGRRA